MASTEDELSPDPIGNSAVCIAPWGQPHLEIKGPEILTLCQSITD